MLYLCGYGLELDDLRAFRSFGSRTPGHPEAGHTVGVEVTTGPLGQGFGDAVGMAIAERVLRERFGSELVDHYIWAIAGDGCLMEGVSHEAASLAGHLGLGRLNVVYDDNRITIDGSTQLAFTDDVGQRFEAYGWHVEYLGEIADDTDALERALLAARAVDDRPSLLVLRSHVAYPSPTFTDDHEAHGNPFKAADVTETKAVMGIPDEPFWSPPDVVAAYREETAERWAGEHERWEHTLAGLDPDERAAWDAAWGATGIAGWEDRLPTFAAGEQVRHARRHRQGGRARWSTPSPAWSPAPPTSPGTPAPSCPRGPCPRPPRPRAAASCTTACASTAWARRWSAWPVTAGSCRWAGRSSCSSTTCVRRCGWPRSPGRRSCSCGRTTRSESARTARPTSRSSTSPRCARSRGCR